MAAGIARRKQVHELSGCGRSGNAWALALSFERRIWEGGHSVVTLDPKENFCGCGGRAPEGILTRSMRLRFLDLERKKFLKTPARVMRAAPSCDAVHRALTAATATCIHMEGPEPSSSPDRT